MNILTKANYRKIKLRESNIGKIVKHKYNRYSGVITKEIYETGGAVGGYCVTADNGEKYTWFVENIEFI